MKLKLRNLLVLAAAMLSFASLGLAQTALTQTTLSQAMSTPGTLGATSVVYLASVTGITAASTQVNSEILIGRELDDVLTVNSTAKTVTVVRGVGSTVAVGHPSGDMVLIGPPNAFFKRDPISGTCAGTSDNLYTPFVNVLTGAQWLCSSVTTTWVPGWNNATPTTARSTATVASAAGAVTPSGPFFDISGTSAITGFNIPVGFNGTAVGGGCFTVRPSAIWTWTAAGNIQKAGTVTAADILVTFCWDANLSKWVPSRVS